MQENTAQIKRLGTVKVTDGDRTETFSAIYSAADILNALRLGHSMTAIIGRMEAIERQDVTHTAIKSSRNAFPVGM